MYSLLTSGFITTKQCGGVDDDEDDDAAPTIFAHLLRAKLLYLLNMFCV